MMTLFGEERDSGAAIHNIIYAINFDSLISLGNESVFLFAILFFNISPFQMAQNHLVITFVFSRLILLLISLIIHKLTKVYKNVSYIHDKYFVIVFAIMHVLIILNENQIFKNNSFSILPIIINLMIFILVAITYYIYCASLSESFKHQQTDYLSLQLAGLEDNTDIFNKKENEIRTMKHDLVNQLTIMDGFLRNGDISECQEIIRKNIGELSRIPVWIDSGYTAITAILSVKFSLAKSEGIQTYSFIQLADLSREQEYDIALIIGNLIDNAIENIASEKKNITLRITQKEQIIIIIENTTDSKTIDLITKKNDKKNHGLGLNSVRLLSKKYNGHLTIDLSDGLFIAIVILDSIPSVR